MEADQTPQAPVVQITGGNPTDEEAAVVTALLAAVAAGSAPVEESDDRPLAGGWKTYLRQMRRPIPPGREAWRYSARP